MSVGLCCYRSDELLRCARKLPFGLQPREQGLEEVIARTDSLPADLDLCGLVDEDARDLLTKVEAYMTTGEKVW